MRQGSSAHGLHYFEVQNLHLIAAELSFFTGIVKSIWSKVGWKIFLPF